MSLLSFLVLFTCFFISIPGFSSTPNPLNGQHLRVIWPLWSGNPKGIVGPIKGGVILEFLSQRLNFTYEMVRVTDATLGPLENGKGLFNYLLDQRCELLVQHIHPTFQTNAVVDLTLPWAYSDCVFAIPIPVETANINAVVKPFQWQIWLGLGISIVCVIAILNLLQRYLESYRSAFEMDLKTGNKPRAEKWQTEKQFLYVFGNLLSQGGFCPSKWLPYRLVAGVWTLAAFIFVQAYTSTLFTYVVTPINHPLINSVYDVAGSSDVKSFVLDEIRKDYKKTGKCNFQIAKESFLSATASFALPKNSPYTPTISQGLLELMQIGLIDHWDTWFRPMPPQCNGKPQSGNKTKKTTTPLSLKNLTGAFLLDDEAQA
ncbi:hypothetical protein DAPPUDRAFT_241436 [Daphnia pulex]|uniref:Ionotropic glutamate receptor C-terminal domain-containing protein n=1 Tax=Daphnia pulex TaxID=6669 RepID=E9GE91_DAPPU|nr:hypothetical protein DAPPUDRAFT_241436 [Daphnia pulex]|eukprot:EFX82352.1 hypothetical protein DAPPUDRAFT_241436 [Daphnia pulex]